MKIKKGVMMYGLKVEMQKVLKTANHIWTKSGQELVITAGLDGVHSAGSLHYYGYALDFRTRYFTVEKAKKIVEELKSLLPSAYDVVWHSSHIHVEYDPKG